MNWLQQTWSQIQPQWLKSKEDETIPLDQVSRFYQSDIYHSLDAELKSAFYDGPLGGLDSRIIERSDIDFLNDSYQLWEQGRNVSCAIFGEKGTGLTTLLNCFTSRLKQKNKSHSLLTLNKRLSDEQDIIAVLVKQFGLEDKPYKLDDFIQLLQSQPPATIILDNVHFLVQRTLAAKGVIHCLSTIILATRGHHFWLLSCEEQAWRRLCYGYQFENLISHEHHVLNLNESQMRTLLINRFSYAGFDTINDLSLEKLPKEKSPLNDITKRSKGCIELALFYCLNHLTYGTKQKSILLMPPKEIDTSPLKKLSQDALFTLAEISTHGQLSPKEHMNVFRMDINQSKMLLEHLRVLGILDQNEDANHSQAYKLKLVISAVVIRNLISMNYLY